MVLIAVTAASIAFLVGFLLGQYLERRLLWEDRASLRAQGELLTKVHAFETPKAAREWQAALEPPKPKVASESEAIEKRVKEALTQSGSFRGASVTVDKDTRLVSLISSNPSDPIALHDYTESEILRWLNSQ